MYQAVRKYINADYSIDIFLLFIFSTMLFLFLGYDVVNTFTSICHSAEALNMYDNQILYKDLDVIASKNIISPRIGGNLLYLFFLKCGFTYVGINVLLYMVSSIMLGICVTFIVHKEQYHHPYFCVLILTLLIGYTKVGVYAGFGIFDTQNPTMCLATSLSILSITIAMYNKEMSNISYIMIALASVLHIHEGIYGFIIVSIILYYYTRNDLFTKYGIHLAIITLLALTLPNLIESRSVLTSSEFYQIYVRWRTPHHLYIFNYGYWPHFLMLLSYMSILFYANRKKVINEDKWLYVFFIFCFIAIGFTWYVSHEIMQSKFFMKMYLPKMVKYISFLFTLLLVKTISDELNRGYVYPVLFFAVNLFFTPFIFQTSTSWAFCIVTLTVMSVVSNKYKYKNALWILLIMLTLYALINQGRYNLMYMVYLYGIMLMTLFVLNSKTERIVLVLMLIPLINLKINLKAIIKAPQLFAEKTIRTQAGDELFKVSKYIKKTISNNNTILCDAFNWNGSYVQYLSERPIYADFGTLPSSEEGVKEWAQRCKNIEGMPSWSPIKLHRFMSKNNINYVLLENNTLKETYYPLFSLEYRNGGYSLYKRRM